MAGSWRNRSDRASSVSGVDNPLLPSVDLRNANQQLLSHQQVDQKCFKVKLKGTIVLHTMIFKRETKDSIFSNLCSKFELEESNATVQYPVREGDGSTGIVTIINDQFLQDSLEIFYASCEEWSTVIVEGASSTSRPPHPREHSFSTIFTDNFTVDLRFYQFLEENIEICQTYLKLRKYVSLILGVDCSNLLNPGLYICHIKGCESMTSLGSFNNISKIIAHVKKHSERENTSCKAVIARHEFLTDKLPLRKNKKKSTAFIYIDDLSKELEKMNAASANNSSLVPDLKNKFFVLEGMDSFQGKHLLVDKNIVEKIALGDESALSSPTIPATRNRIQSFYTKECIENPPVRKRKVGKKLVSEIHQSSGNSSTTAQGDAASASASNKSSSSAQGSSSSKEVVAPGSSKGSSSSNSSSAKGQSKKKKVDQKKVIPKKSKKADPKKDAAKKAATKKKPKAKSKKKESSEEEEYSSSEESNSGGTSSSGSSASSDSEDTDE